MRVDELKIRLAIPLKKIMNNNYLRHHFFKCSEVTIQSYNIRTTYWHKIRFFPCLLPGIKYQKYPQLFLNQNAEMQCVNVRD